MLISDSMSINKFIRSSSLISPKYKYAKHRVLIIEPDRVFRNIHLFFLKCIGFTKIDFACSGEKALEYIKNYNYSLILFETSCLDYTGFYICKIIRKSIKNNNAKIILATTYTKESISDLCDIYDISETITKPLFFNEYSDVVKKCLSK